MNLIFTGRSKLHPCKKFIC